MILTANGGKGGRGPGSSSPPPGGAGWHRVREHPGSARRYRRCGGARPHLRWWWRRRFRVTRRSRRPREKRVRHHPRCGWHRRPRRWCRRGGWHLKHQRGTRHRTRRWFRWRRRRQHELLPGRGGREQRHPHPHLDHSGSPRTPVRTTLSSDTTTPGEYLSLVNTDTSRGLNTGYGSPYGWGIGAGRGDGSPQR